MGKLGAEKSLTDIRAAWRKDKILRAVWNDFRIYPTWLSREQKITQNYLLVQENYSPQIMVVTASTYMGDAGIIFRGWLPITEYVKTAQREGALFSRPQLKLPIEEMNGSRQALVKYLNG